MIGLLWMIYDIINAPAVDDDEIQVSTEAKEVPPVKGVIQPIQKKEDTQHQESEADKLS